MKVIKYIVLLVVLLLIGRQSVMAQCNNVGFESGDFSNWTGSYAGNSTGFDAAAIDAAPNTNKPHCIVTSGFDATVGGSLLPVVCPLISGNSKSLRLGNQVGSSAKESVSYSFTVDANSTNFTYYYAVVLDASSTHSELEQPYFKIKMTNSSGADITCATYDVNSTSAGSIGGFKSASNTPSGSFLPINSSWKDWSAVTIPLQLYIGQNVTITFETRDCTGATGTPGIHWGYAYLDASCAPLEILKSAPSVCPGQTVLLTAPAAKAYSWKAPPGGGIVSGTTSSTVSVNAPGTYTVTLTAFGEAGCTYDLTADMPPFKPGDGVAVNSATICSGESVTLTASGGAPYSWSTGQTTPSITVNPTSTTTYSVTGGTCVSTNSATVTVNSYPTSTFTGTTVCANVTSTITFTGNGDANTTYTWGFDGGTATPGTGMGPHSVVWSTAGTKNVTLTTANGTCTATPSTVNVSVNAIPSLTVTPTTICAGDNGTISAAGASSYVWSDAGATANASLAATPTITTTYSVTGTSAGCSNTATGTITVNQLQNATFLYSPATVCKLPGASDPTPTLSGVAGGTFSCANPGLILNASTGVIDLQNSTLGTYTITYTTPGPCPGSANATINIVSTPVADFTFATYCKNEANPLPTFINGGSAGTFSSSGLSFVSTSTGQINLAASTAGTYVVTNTINSAGCPVTTYSVNVTINAVPVVTVDNPTACSGQPAIITANGATNYTWPDNSNGNTYSVLPGTTTPYTVTGETNGCTSTATSTVTVNANPTVTVQSKTVCEGTRTAVYASGATSYSWSDGSSLDSLVITNPTTTQSFTVTGTANACTGTAISTITVNPLPTITVNSPAICQGLSGTITPSGGGSYIWSDTVFAGSRTITPTSTRTYTVFGSSATCPYPPATPTQLDFQTFFMCWSAGCRNTAVSTVTLVQKPVLTVNSPTICAGESTTLTANGAASYEWTPGNTTGNTLTITPGASTSYTVSDNTAGCSGFAVSNITVTPVPVLTATTSPVCQGQTGTVTAIANVAGGATYQWSNGAVTNPMITAVLQNTSSYTVTASSIVNPNCKATATATVIVNPLPTITVTNDTICQGELASITAAGATSYVWLPGGSNANPLIVPPAKSTNYVATGTDDNNCSSTGIGRVEVYDIPNAQFSFTPDKIMVLEPSVNFIDQSTGGANAWSWDFGDGVMDNTQNPKHTYPGDTASYIVTLAVSNAGGCNDTIAHIVVINPETSIYIPNAFTPDGDGKNDIFNVSGQGIIEYRMMIFDRWGNFIFTTDDLDKGWDGKANSGTEVAQQDVYVWKVRITDVFKKQREYIGTVTLMRGE